MARTGYKISKAKCAVCGCDGPARTVAAKQGWTRRGPEQRRAWYCPEHKQAAPAEPAPVGAPSPMVPATPIATDPPADPFECLRWERDRELRAEHEARRAAPLEPTTVQRLLRGGGAR